MDTEIKDDVSEQIPPVRIFLEWQFKEFNKRQRPMRWWLGATVVWLGLCAWAIFSQHSFLFVLVLLFGAIIFVTIERREPDTLVGRITSDGIEVDDHLYAYEDVEKFYIVYRPPMVKTLFLVRRSLGPIIGIPLDNQNPSEVKRVLAPRLKEEIEQINEPLLDQIARILGLH